jgi:hypothetical protein
MIAGAYTRSRLPLSPLFSPYPFCHLTRVLPKKAYCGRRPHSLHKKLTLASSLIRPTSDVWHSWDLTLLVPRTHPLTYLYMFRTNVLDLTRDNRISFLSSRSYRLVFRLPGHFFVIVNRRSQSMLLLPVDTHSRRIRPPDRPTV